MPDHIILVCIVYIAVHENNALHGIIFLHYSFFSGHMFGLLSHLIRIYPNPTSYKVAISQRKKKPK